MHFKIEDNLFSFVAYNGKYVMLSRKMGKDLKVSSVTNLN